MEKLPEKWVYLSGTAFEVGLAPTSEGGSLRVWVKRTGYNPERGERVTDYPSYWELRIAILTTLQKVLAEEWSDAIKQATEALLRIR